MTLSFARKSVVVAGLMAALGAASTARAEISFDLDGVGGAAAINIESFDWTQSSFLAKGGNTAIRNFLTNQANGNNALSVSFDVLTHGKLSNFLDKDGNSISLNGNNASISGDLTAGNQNSFAELTFVAKFSEKVVGIDANGVVTFATIANSSSFLELYYQRTPTVTTQAKASSGSGFNDGILILQASDVGVGASGSFGITNTTPVALSPGNYSAAQQSQTGGGSQSIITAQNVVVDGNFFISPISTFSFAFDNISLAVPFTTVSPSDCFADVGRSGTLGTNYSNAASDYCSTAHANANTMALQDAAGTNAYKPVIGAVNADLTNGAPDFIAQTDINSPVSTRVPEPGVLLLAGLALAAVGATSRRRRV